MQLIACESVFNYTGKRGVAVLSIGAKGHTRLHRLVLHCMNNARVGLVTLAESIAHGVGNQGSKSHIPCLSISDSL